MSAYDNRYVLMTNTSARKSASLQERQVLPSTCMIVAVVKGAISGIWKGAKNALKKGNEEE